MLEKYDFYCNSLQILLLSKRRNNHMKKINIAFYDTKPYDKESFLLMNKNFGFNIEFFDFHLNEKTAFSSKENTPCPLTEKLVNAGYQQTSGGYIERARKESIEVNFKKNLPSQYWHLMTYCNSRNETCTFGKSIVCGELIFWMAEVL
jgi:hypothetical protein